MIKRSTTQAALAARVILTMFVLLTMLQISGCASQPNPALNLGGIDLEEAFKGQMKRVDQILGGINSLESAEKANAELQHVSMSIDDLVFNSAKLSPEGQTALSILAVKEASNMEILVGQVNGSPVLRDAIGETMQGILERIRQLI